MHPSPTRLTHKNIDPHTIDAAALANSFTFPITVYYEDTDAAGVVYYANYLKYLERARTAALKDLGYTHRTLKTLNVVVLVRHVQVAYLRPAALEDTLQVTSSIIKLRPVGITFKQDIFNGDVHVLDAVIEMACVSCSGGVAAWPPLVFKTLQMTFKGDGNGSNQ